MRLTSLLTRHRPTQSTSSLMPYIQPPAPPASSGHSKTPSSFVPEEPLPEDVVPVEISRNVVLSARVCTPGRTSPPSDGGGVAGVYVDPSLPTILFCHPTWLDSYFLYAQHGDSPDSSYPQLDDTLFAGGCNLVAFDMRGHGLTKVVGRRDETYDAWVAADDLARGLTRLGVESAHVVGVAFGAVVGRNLASAHPHRVASLTLISLPPDTDNEDTAHGYVECQEALETAAQTGCADTLDGITEATFAYDAGTLAPAVRDIRDEYVLLARERLGCSADASSDAAFYIWDPVVSRLPQTPEQIERIACPVLILQTTADEPALTEDAETWASNFNALHDDGPRADVLLADNVGNFMTLTSPNVINPLIAKFIGTPSSSGLPELSELGTRIEGVPEPRTPKTPRALVALDISPLSSPRGTLARVKDSEPVSVTVQVVKEVFG